MKKPNRIVGIYPDVSAVTAESTAKILSVCGKILELCAEEKLTISDMQCLPDVLCGEIRRAVSKQVSNEIFKNC